MSKVIRNIATQHPIWTSQPSGVSQVQHPAFSKGTSYIYAPWVTPNTVLTPSGSALNMTVRGSPKVVTSPVGYAGKFVASNSDCITNQNFLPPFTFPRITIAIASAGATTGSIRSIIGVANYGGRYTGIRASAAANTFEYQYYGSGTNALLIGTTTFADDTVCVIVGVSYNTFDHELYVNGKLEATSTTGGGGDPGVDSVMVGCANDARIWDLRANGLIVFGAVGQGSLSRPSVKQLAQNPYQIFTPQSRQIPIDLVRGPPEPRQSYMMGTTAPEISTAMPAAILKTPWTSQPQGAVEVDWSNPITAGLLRSYDFGSSGRDATRQGVSKWSVGSSTPRPTTSGRGLRVTGRGQVVSGESLSSKISTGITLLLIAEKHGQITGSSDFLFGETTSADAADFNWGFYEYASTGNLSAYVKNASSASANVVGGTQWIAGKGPQIWAMTYGDGDNFIRLYLNGVQVGSAAQTGLIKQTALLTSVVGWNSASSVPNFTLIRADVWNRNIGSDGVARLSANPWQIFAPQSKQIWVAP